MKLTCNVLSIYKLEIKTHWLKGTNISHLLSCIEKASQKRKYLYLLTNVFLFPVYTYKYKHIYIHIIYIIYITYIHIYTMETYIEDLQMQSITIKKMR